MFSRKAIREVAGHSRMLWFLPAFACVLGLVVAVESSMSHPDDFLVTFWSVVAIAFLVVSILVAVVRALDRRYLRDLDLMVSQEPLSSVPTLARYEIHVGLVLIQASFHTPFRPAQSEQAKYDKWLACGITGLLGWWSLSGPFVTPFVIWRNLHGGQEVAAPALLAALQDASV